MTEIKYARNPRFVDRWAPAIGKLILDFGLLELESYLWLLQMPDEPQVFPELPFSKRISRIYALVNRQTFDRPWVLAASEAWTKAGDLAELRNSLAHSPLMFGWESAAEEGDPDWIGVVDLRSLGLGKKEAESRYSLSRIAQTT
ncbi:MAG: hypothetical protein NTV92_09490, partial [Candidatus Bipolaricaulota bacterium]|nr:hypothetical protein [Candidatus Bipolaricaulota bacterium]